MAISDEDSKAVPKEQKTEVNKTTSSKSTKRAVKTDTDSASEVAKGRGRRTRTNSNKDVKPATPVENQSGEAQKPETVAQSAAPDSAADTGAAGAATAPEKAATSAGSEDKGATVAAQNPANAAGSNGNGANGAGAGAGAGQGSGPKRGIYPIITLRSIIITPAANVQLIAARENTVLALKEALERKQDIVVISQTADSELRPAKEDLARVGVVANILNGSYNEKDQYRSTIRGFARVSIVRLIDDPSDQVRHAEVEFLKEQEVEPLVAARYIDALKAALHTALDIQKQGGRAIMDSNIPAEMISTICDSTTLGDLADGLSQILMLPNHDKKYILESLDPVARAKSLIAFLNNFSYKAEVDKKIAEDARAAMDRSQRDFYLNEQLKAIKRELNIQVDDSNDIEEYRQRIAALDAPEEVLNRLQKEVSRLSIMSLNSGENSMVRNYIDTLLSIPWRKSSQLNRDLSKARDILEQDHYGLKKVKDRILEFLAVQTRREQKDPHGQILCLMGPPGIGKTSLAASIAKATGRKYVRVALGGMYDESEIRGHRRTYIGAMPGRIIQSMIKSEVNNPLFLLDEIDKISTNSYHGDIASALLEVLDPEQNNTFNDNYVDLEYDLSHVFFIATANSYNIPPALRDRMEIIDLSSYTADEKFHIAREHLLPKQLEKNALTPEEFDISDDGLKELIVHYTLEAGVRNLERIIAELCRKVVKELMIKPPKDPSKVKKRVLGVKEIQKLIGPKRYDFTSKLKDNRIGVVNGLSVSSVGGDMLQVEVVANEGKGSHLLTGQLGSVMKESVFAAIAWVRSHARAFSMAPDFYQYVDLNVHFPEGAIPKDGPSAGCATVTAIISALTNNPVRAVCIPQENEKDLWDIPKNVTTKLEIVPVKTIDEVLDIALVNKPKTFKPTTLEDWTLEGYLEREKKRKLRDEAEEHKFYMEIKDSSEGSIGEIKNHRDQDVVDTSIPSVPSVPNGVPPRPEDPNGGEGGHEPPAPTVSPQLAVE